MNAQPPPEGCLSDLALDRMAAAQAGRSAHLDGCERCRARVELFEAAAASAAVRRVLDQVASRAPAHASFVERHGFRLRLGLAGACAAAAAAIAVVAVRPSPPPPPDDVRIKGTSLAFFRQRAGAVTHGVSGDSFKPGDALRFVVSSGSPGYFFLVGVLPSGEVVAYHPYGGTKSVPIAGGEMTLPGSLVLDESKGTEYFGGLFSREPLALEDVRTAVRGALERDSALPAQGLDLPATQHWIVIRKP